MIRRLAETDIPEVIDLMKMLRVESQFFQHYPEDGDYVAHQLYKMLHSPVHVLLIEPGKGVFFGYTGMPWWSPYYEATEMLLAVFEEYRGTSTGIRLIRAFEQECIERGCRSIHVGVSLGINDEKTVSIYKRLGYNQVGTSLIKRISDV